MPSVKLTLTSVDVEVKIAIGGFGRSSMFDPNHPFVHGNYYHALPYWNFNNEDGNLGTHNGGEYWIIEENFTITPPNLNLLKAFNCFSQVPTAGAHYSIKLCVDIPDNNKPDALPLKSGSETGHTFIIVNKTNGSKSVTQVFGFYATEHPGYFDPWRPMPSVIKNNQLREVNASIEMNLTESQFEIIRKKAFELARQKYKAASYNCTNFSMDLFNSVRAYPLIIETYTIYLPSDINLYGIPKDPERLEIGKTPQKLFKKLKEIKDSNTTESSHINIDQTDKTKAPLSHGECN